ncbi:uncharacterized protein LOC126249568 [Schistocerca nitens]|uniref:uncharacterized protein LOC126249568 n=1 Tax=Schistocerca nitens TaxID=7011 RepID=UPI002118418A|nr:uncharacterized protein LOC126249568 [Schistocerca nitens]
MQRPLAALIAFAALAAAQNPECNPLGDMRGCSSPERCEEVFVEGLIGEKITRVNASCHNMLDVAENRSRDAKMQAAMTNKEMWKRMVELYPQVCRLRQNATEMQEAARRVLDTKGDTIALAVASACREVLEFPAGTYDVLAERVLTCFRNFTVEVMESARRLEEQLISGSMERIEQTAQILEECIPDVESCDLPEEDVAAMVECVARREAEKSLDEREKELGIFATHLVTFAGANYTMLVQRMSRCFAYTLDSYSNATEALWDNNSQCTGVPRVKDEL